MSIDIHIGDDCTLCGDCEVICPEVFKMGDDKCEVIKGVNYEKHLEQIKEAIDTCPFEVISIKKVDDMKEKLIKKIKRLKEYGVTINHDPKNNGMGGSYYGGGHTVSIGMTTIEKLNKICDELLEKEEERLNYDSSEIDELLKEAYKK